MSDVLYLLLGGLPLLSDLTCPPPQIATAQHETADPVVERGEEAANPATRPDPYP